MNNKEAKDQQAVKAAEAGDVPTPSSSTSEVAGAPRVGAVAADSSGKKQIGKPGLRNKSKNSAGESVASKPIAAATGPQVGAVSMQSSNGDRNTKPGLRNRNSTNQTEQQPVAPIPATEATAPQVGAVSMQSVSGGQNRKPGLRNRSSAGQTGAPALPSTSVVEATTPQVGAVRCNTGKRLGESKAKREMRGSRATTSAAVTAKISETTPVPEGARVNTTDVEAGHKSVDVDAMMAALENDQSKTSVTYTESLGPEIMGLDFSDRSLVRGKLVPTSSVATPVDDSPLVTARPVDEEEPLGLQAADEWDQEKEAKVQAERQQKTTKRNRTFLGGGLVVVAAIVLLAVLLTKNNGEGTIVVANTTDSPTLSPSAAPSWEGNYILELLPDFTNEAILREDSPQYQAYDWLVKDPAWSSYSDIRILQRFALATLFLATGGDTSWASAATPYKWIINSTFGWMNHSVHECDWAFSNKSEVLLEIDFSSFYLAPDNPCTQQKLGVGSDGEEEERIYQHIWLDEVGLAGSTFPPEVYLLTHLRSISLSGNKLTGTISSLVGSLTSLEALALDNNWLTGTIPEELASCTNLTALILVGDKGSGKNLTGTLPASLGRLQDLKHLWVEAHAITGSVPSELGLLSDLTHLYLTDTSLSHSLPTEIGQMGKLKALQTYDSGFTGPLPSELGLLSLLEWADICCNSFSGSIPSELGHAQNLITFYVNENQLSGSLPTELGLLTGLTGDLELNRNRFTGVIPSQLGLLSSASYINIGRNEITGMIPSELGQLSKVLYLWVQNNMLTGTIPTELGLLSSLEELTLKVNELSGSIPTEVSALPYLLYFDATVNQLTGEVPLFESAESGYFEEAGWIYIALWNNSLSGVIPQEMCSLGQDTLLFDCSDMLCGCSCACPNATNGTNAISLADTTTDMTANATSLSNVTTAE